MPAPPSRAQTDAKNAAASRGTTSTQSSNIGRDGGFGGGGGGSKNPTGGSLQAPSRTAPSAARPAARGNQTGVGGPGGGGGMGAENARKGSSKTPVGPKSGRDAPGNIGGGVKYSTARDNDRRDNSQMQKSIRDGAQKAPAAPRKSIEQGFIKSKTPLGRPDTIGGMGTVSMSGLADPRFNTGGRILGDTTTRQGMSRFGNVGGQMVGTLGSRGVPVGQAAAAQPAPTPAGIQRQNPFARHASPGLPPGYAARYLGGAAGAMPTGSQPPRSAPPPAAAPQVAGMPVAPSQEYFGGPDVSPSQYAGQAQNLRELVNRYRYERDAAKRGFRDLPGRIGQAIREGDFRAFQPRGDQGQGGQNARQQQMPAPMQAASTDVNSLVQQLLAVLEAQQSQGVAPGPSQMDLVYNAFV